MTKEDKELLLRDLCARLPYGVVVELDEKFGFNKGIHSLVKELLDSYCVEGIKPYLRPMSSMNGEELVEYKTLEKQCETLPTFAYISVSKCILFDWLNAHHFDYRGLIEKGLALEAPEGIYNLNK